MYLEVHIESTEPQVFLVDQNEVVVGSLADCDIHIAVPSVSKKHLRLMLEDKKWYAVDAGSTNGTYIDSERLIPGQRKEILINQYVRLGDIVHVALVKHPQNNNEAPKPVPRPVLPVTPEKIADEKTRVVSLKELKEARSVPKTAEANAPIVVKKVKRPRSISNKSIILCGAIIMLGYILNKKFTKDLSINKINLPAAADKAMKRNSSAADKITE